MSVLGPLHNLPGWLWPWLLWPSFTCLVLPTHPTPPTQPPLPPPARAVSSQLEGLFISLVSISCGGHMQGDTSFGSDVRSLRLFRLAQFGGVELLDARRVCQKLEPLVSALHDLFWPRQPGLGSLQRQYRDTVTPAEVQDVCKRVAEQHCDCALAS